MYKKKNQAKINLPLVSINKPTETAKSYVPKSNNHKFRDIQEKNVFFEMPSIHQNDLSIKNLGEIQEKLYKKIQFKILKRLEQNKQNRLLQEWELYIKKSDILNSRSGQFNEIQQFLLKVIYKYFIKFYENQSFNFTNSFNFGSSETEQYKNMTINDHYNRTMQSSDKHFIGTSLKQKGSFEHTLKVGSSLLNEEESSTLNILNHRNVILQKKVQLYEQRILQLEANIQQYESKQNAESSEKMKTNDIMQTIMLKNKFKYESEIKTIQIETINRQITYSKNLLQEYKKQLQKKQAKYRQLQKQNKQYKQYLKYKQLWLMASEEASTWQTLGKQMNEQNQKGIFKIKMLKDKNRQLLNYFNMNNAVNPDQQEEKQDLDKIIKEFKDWLMIISVPKVNLNFIPQNLQEQSEKTDINAEVDLKLLRPNFYIFFEAFQNTFKIEKNIINIRPIEYNFYLKIRVIFDAFFRHFLIASSYKEYPSFPEFVIGFLQKYQINTENHRVEYRKTPIQNEQKITFIVNLFNKNFCNTWQCEIFKDFLLENYYLDEIFFYLECRNQFNNGIPTNQTLGSTDPITFVKLTKALKIVVKKLMPYENYIVEKVKNILKSKKKIKFGEAYIDKNFVLKLLLEIYALERPKSQRIFESSFKTTLKKSYITYGDFHNFMDKNFYFLSSPQIAELYRQIYLISSGHVTCKAIHYICGVKGLFVPLLIQKRIMKNNQQKSINKDMLLLDIQNTFAKISSHLPDSGYEPFMRVQASLNDFMRQIDYYRNNKSAFYQKVYQQKCNILKINNLLQMAASYEINPSEALEESEIQSNIIQLHSLIHEIDSQVHLISRQKERRGNCLKMLVHNFKVRIQESIMQFEIINDEEINKLKNQLQKGVERKVI